MTQNGKAKVVMPNIDSYERTQEMLPCSRFSPWETANSKRAKCNPPLV